MKQELTIKRHPVNSTNILSAGYDAPSKTLEIVFSNGATYRYSNVPQSTVTAMWGSDSVGGFVQKHIAHTYSFKKMS